MNKMVFIIIAIVATFFCVNMVWGLSNTMLETPEYKVIKKSGSYEVRKYEPMIIARTLVRSDYKEATSTGFRRIANYIFGGNEKNMEIAMTAPVLSNSPVDVDSEYEISFVMPSSFKKETLPEPNSSNVEIMGRSLDLVACISFGGWATESRVKTYHEKLNNWIEKERLKIDGKFMIAQYNSPWALPPFRHNEILVRISK